MIRLKIIIASTRPGRKGPAVGAWITGLAQAHDAFEVEVLDLATIALPMMDEAEHPRLQKYAHAHTRAWSGTIAGADAFIFVMPEYNFGFTAPLKNALDFLFHEWAHKPVGLVSYGGIAGGMRAVQLLKPVLVALRLTPAADVPIPFFTKLIDAEGRFNPTEELTKSANGLFTNLVKWDGALRTLRTAP
jgi:NAD(P)H-dependent FMN reductase